MTENSEADTLVVCAFFHYCLKSNNSFSFTCSVTPEVDTNSCNQMFFSVIVILAPSFVLSRSINRSLVFRTMVFMKNDALLWQCDFIF